MKKIANNNGKNRKKKFTHSYDEISSCIPRKYDSQKKKFPGRKKRKQLKLFSKMMRRKNTLLNLKKNL